MSMKRTKRKTALALTLAAVIGLTAACSSGGGNNETANNNADEPTNAGKNDAQTEQAPAAPVDLTFWSPLNGNALAAVKNMGDIAMVQEWEKRTNVKFTFQHPAAGSENEQLNVLFASNDLPDLITNTWSNADLAKHYSDGSIIKLNDLIDKYAPNLKKALADNPQVANQIEAENGDIYAFPNLSLGEYKVFGGPMIRKDWLDELGLQAPETVDEWENVLRAFKEKKKVEYPLLIGANASGGNFQIGTYLPAILEAYGTTYDFYLDNGTVKFGAMQPGYKDFLATFAKWYKEGLLDPDFGSVDSKTLDAKITSGKVGIFSGFIGGGLGKYLPALRETDPKADLTALQYPVLNKGDQPMFINRSWEFTGNGVVITQSNKHPEESVKALDYLFSPEGNLLKNFGIEGETYTMVDGKPKYTDLILNNPDKLPVAQAMAKYFIANYPFAGMSNDPNYLLQYYQFPEQKDALATYSKYADNALKTLVPPISLTTDEGQELNKIMSDVNTYRDQMLLKFIMGAEPLDNFDKYVDQLKKLKIERAVEIENAAYQRYIAKQ